MESTGMIGAAVYILLLTFFAPLPYYSHFLPAAPLAAAASHGTAGAGAGAGAAEAGVAFPHHSLTTYLASLLSLLIATFLGFLDDLFDIRWRYKLPIPSASTPARACACVLDSAPKLRRFSCTVIASVPLLVVYFAGHGVTDVVIPRTFGLRALVGADATNGLLRLGEHDTRGRACCGPR